MSGLDARAAHHALLAAFARSTGHADVVETPFALPGGTVVQQVVGPDLAAATARPFAHLGGADEPDGAPTFSLWSSHETGVARPDHPWPWPQGMAVSGDGAIVVHADRWSVTALDRSEGSVVGHRSSAAGLAAHERAKPFPEILAVRLLDLGLLKVHAGAVGRGGAVVLIAGGSGAGKSTAALACASAGLTYLGDDQVALRLAGTPTVESLYSAARIEASHLAAHPALACGLHPEAAPGEKLLLFLAESEQVVLGRAAAAVAIVVPQPADGAASPSLVPISGAQALLALAPSSVLGVIGGGGTGFDRLAQLAGTLPCFALHHAGDPACIPDLVDEALSRAGV